MALKRMTIPPDVAARMKRFVVEWNHARGNELAPGAGGMRLIAPHPLYRYLGQQGGLETLKQRDPDGWRAFVRTARGDLAMLEYLGGDGTRGIRLHIGGVPQREWEMLHRARGTKRLAGRGAYSMNALVAPALHRSWIWFKGARDHLLGERWMSGQEWERSIAAWPQKKSTRLQPSS